MFALPVVSSEEMEISLLFRMCDPESLRITFWKKLGDQTVFEVVKLLVETF